MIVVFVSRDDAEFNRYAEGCGEEKSNRTISCRLPPRIRNAVNDLDFQDLTSISAVFTDVHDAQVANSQGVAWQPGVDAETVSVEYLFPLKAMTEYYKNDVFVMVIRSNEHLCRLKISSKNERYVGENSRELLFLIDVALKDALPQLTDRIAGHDVHLLVHWGGLRDLAGEEDAFNKAIEEADHKTIFGCRRLVFHELSSRRPCFDVQKHVISVPVEKEKLGALLEQFGAERKFARIKDVLSRFVVGELSDADEKLVGDFFSGEDFRSRLRAAIAEPQLNWLRTWEPFMNYLRSKNDVQSKAMLLLRSDKERARKMVVDLFEERLIEGAT